MIDIDNRKFEKQFIEECKLLSQKERIEKILTKLESLGCNDRDIDLLIMLVEMEHQIGCVDSKKYPSYYTNISQTYEKQLRLLILNKNKQIKRVNFWKDVVKEFKTDLLGQMARFNQNLDE